MKVNKSLLVGIAITLVASVGISAIVFKPMGTVATEKNNAELYLEMKEQAKEEVQAELRAEFSEQLSKVKDDTNLEIQKLKTEYDKAIAEAKLQQVNEIQSVVKETQNKIEEATSWKAIEDKRQEEAKKSPNYSEVAPIEHQAEQKEPEGIKITN